MITIRVQGADGQLADTKVLALGELAPDEDLAGMYADLFGAEEGT